MEASCADGARLKQRFFRIAQFSAGNGVRTPRIEDLLRQTLVRIGKNRLGWDIANAASAKHDCSIVDVFASEIGGDFSQYRLAKAFLLESRSQRFRSLRRGTRDLETVDRKDQHHAEIVSVAERPDASAVCLFKKLQITCES